MIRYLSRRFLSSLVVEVLKGLIPYTLLVFFTGTVIAFLFGQWLGKVVACSRSGLFSGTS